ncbi:MAG: hypothetical protein KDE26_26565, partial [Bacteroidetes bacterium]|nr:hypothetical protein [Bacteroidota bacterium]
MKANAGVVPQLRVAIFMFLFFLKKIKAMSSRSNTIKNINISAMQELLEHDNHETRSQLKELFKDPLFIPRFNISMDEERELALKRLQKICDHHLIS